MNDRGFTFGDGPVHRMLGLELLERTPDHAEIRMPARADLLQEYGVVQGGILSALADAAAIYLILGRLSVDRSPTSIEFKLNFLTAATPDGGDLTARAEPVKLGRSLAVCRCTVRQGERAVAEGLFTYLVSER